MEQAELEGGCLCGAVRYRCVHVDDPGFCHCRACQRVSGAGAVPWVRVDAIEVEGRTATFAEGAHGERVFCPRCGTGVAERGDGVWIALGTLDDPDAIAPRWHRQVRHQRRWAKLWDGWPRFADAEPPRPRPSSWRKAADPSVSATSPITSRPIVTEADRLAVASLQVSGRQMRFVAPNVMSLMQAAFAETEVWLRAIFAGDVVVGLCLIHWSTEDAHGLALTGKPYLWRFMVDEHYQGFGIGRRALVQAMAEMAARGHREMYLSCVPGPGSPRGFYERLGFTSTGQFANGQDILVHRGLQP